MPGSTTSTSSSNPDRLRPGAAAQLLLALLMLAGYFTAFGFFNLNSVDFVSHERALRLQEQSLPATFELKQGAAANRYALFQDWSAPENSFTWTNGYSPRIQFKIEPPHTKAPLTLRIHTVTAYHASEKNPIPLEIRVNGELAEKTIIRSPHAAQYEITFDPPESDGIVDLALKLENLTSPAALGASGDPRKLGLAVSRIEILETPSQPR